VSEYNKVIWPFLKRCKYVFFKSSICSVEPALNIIFSCLFGKGVLNPSSKHQLKKSKLRFFALFFNVVKKKKQLLRKGLFNET